MQLPPLNRHNQTLLKKVMLLFLRTLKFVAAPCLVPSSHIKELTLEDQPDFKVNRVQRIALVTYQVQPLLTKQTVTLRKNLCILLPG
jgi:hypothetical protein